MTGNFVSANYPVTTANLLRLAYHPTICVFGDSYGLYTNYVAGTKVNMSSNGLWTHLLGRVGYHRFAWEDTIWAGFGGDTSVRLRNRYVNDVVNAGAHDILLSNCGANDFFGNASTYPTAENVLNDVLWIVDQEIAKGVKYIFWTTAPTQGSSRPNYSVARAKEALKYSKLLKAAAVSRPQLIVLELGELIKASRDVTNFASDSAYMTAVDSTHLNGAGGLLFSKFNYSKFESVFPYVNRDFSLADAYTQSWSKSLLAEGIGQMAGSGGTKGTGVDASSTVPTGWTATGTASTNMIVSIIPADDKFGDWVEMNVQFAATDTTKRTHTLNTSSFSSRVSPGDFLSGMFEIQLDLAGGASVWDWFGKVYTLMDGVTLYNTEYNEIANIGYDAITSTTNPNDVPLLAPILTPQQVVGTVVTSSQGYFYFTVSNPTAGAAFAKMRIRNFLPFKYVAQA